MSHPPRVSATHGAPAVRAPDAVRFGAVLGLALLAGVSALAIPLEVASGSAALVVTGIAGGVVHDGWRGIVGLWMGFLASFPLSLSLGLVPFFGDNLWAPVLLGLLALTLGFGAVALARSFRR